MFFKKLPVLYLADPVHLTYELREELYTDHDVLAGATVDELAHVANHIPKHVLILGHVKPAQLGDTRK
ncbi:hypothetical protein DPMN_163713 [Dreissena polymorpha]|uniref:Uncharacterized protein n=1 Tax=Dreissena polymorpha TaxID=45954 RepID=A0A9D4ESD1_DREPO|nr:hypothetical protein DPMN_163713 [Dreissena polymorpha]